MSVFFVPEAESTEIPVRVLDEGAIRAVLEFFGRPGGRPGGEFRMRLLAAFAQADESNFALLFSAFPVEGFWMAALRFRPNGVTLAVRGLDLLGVKAVQS